jgi:hypothetical protein
MHIPIRGNGGRDREGGVMRSAVFGRKDRPGAFWGLTLRDNEKPAGILLDSVPQKYIRYWYQGSFNLQKNGENRQKLTLHASDVASI